MHSIILAINHESGSAFARAGYPANGFIDVPETDDVFQQRSAWRIMTKPA